MSSPPKHELYFSNYCKHSTAILQEVNKSGLQNKFVFICIDKRVVKDNITYILLPNGQQFPLPPMISRVPVLLLKPKFEILSGNQILEFIRPQAKNIQEEKTMLYAEPNPFDLSRDTLRSSGVASDNYSFLDMGPQELAPQGNGGMRQMYSYASIDAESPIQTPLLEGDKKSKMSYTMEDIEKIRNQEFPESIKKQ
jgi:hypothetical protein